jgi:peptidase M28-like protein
VPGSSRLPCPSNAWLLGIAGFLACAPAARTGGREPSNIKEIPAGTAAAEAEGPLKHRPGPTSATIVAGDLMTRLYVFADDSMMGREAGTLGSVKGTAYLASEAQRIGLEPAGENGTYFQNVPMVSAAIDSQSFLSAGGTHLKPGVGFVGLPIVPSVFPFGSSLKGDSAQALYAGRAGDSLSPAVVAQTPGKFVIFGPPLGPDGKPDWRFFARPLPQLPSAAAIAFATLDITPEKGVEFLLQPQMVLATTMDEARGAPFGLLVSASTVTQLFGSSLESLKPGVTGKPVRGQIRFVETPTPAPARNVVAILRGSDPQLRGEYVALGAHNDHLGTKSPPEDHDSLRTYNAVVRPEGENGPPREPTSSQLAGAGQKLQGLRHLRPPRPDSIFNGADDDGSGSVTVLEIAEAFAKGPDRPKRSILFVWHTAEEKGLFGSQWFTDHPTVSRDSIVAQLNMDMVGRGSASDTPGGGPRAVGLVGSRRLSTELGDLIESINRRDGHNLTIDYRYDANGHPDNVYCRSDHYMYARYGIPIAFFSTGLHRDYHEITDEPQYIDYEHMARVAGLVRDVALGVANLDHRLVVDKAKPDPKAPCHQ